MSISALDLALWARWQAGWVAAAAAVGVIIVRNPDYGSGCFPLRGVTAMIEKALHYVKQGYKASKMQVAHVHTPAQDL